MAVVLETFYYNLGADKEVAVKQRFSFVMFTHSGIIQGREGTAGIYAPHRVELRKSRKCWITRRGTRYSEITGLSTSYDQENWILVLSSITPLE